MTIIFQNFTVFRAVMHFAQLKKMKSLDTKNLFFATHVKTKFKVLKYVKLLSN